MVTEMVFTCHPSGLHGEGPLDAEIMIVGVAPAQQEMKSGQLYSGETGQLLCNCFRGLGLDMRRDAYVTNLLCWWAKDPTMEDVSRCLPRLVREIDTIKPKVIVALGSLPVQFFTSHVTKRNSEARGSCIWSDDFNCWVIGTWQPTVVFDRGPIKGQPALIVDIMRDLAKVNYIKDKPKDFGDVTYRVSNSLDDSLSFLRNLPVGPVVSLDVECRWDTETSRWTTDLRCLGISDGQDTLVMPEEFIPLDQEAWPLNVHWTFHNAMFDTQIMRLHGVDLPICDDTMLMSYSLDERGGSGDEVTDIAVGIHGLKRLSREYCGAGFYTVDLKTSPDEVVWEYNAKDAAYTARLANVFTSRQIEENVRHHYLRMTLPQAELFRDEKAHGIYIDAESLNELTIAWGEEWIRLGDELQDEAKAYGWPEAEFNPNSHVQMKRFLQNYLMLPVENTRKETLAQYETHPWLAKHRRRKRLDKNLGTYVIGIRKNVDRDRRVHPDGSIHATTSGRVTYHNPPVGTIPTGSQYVDPDEEPTADDEAIIQEFSRLRGLFGAPKGRVFIEADYTSAELYAAMMLSGDEQMRADLASGDFHSAAAEAMFQCKRTDFTPAHWKGMRRNSKYVTFGVLYFRAARSLFQPALGQSGNLGKFYDYQTIVKMVEAWHKKYWQHDEWAHEVINESRRTGEYRAPTGRLRRYVAPGLYGNHFTNMASNAPVQIVSHDHLIAARLDLQQMYKQHEFPARSLWDGHDAIYFECDGDVVFEGKKAVVTGPAKEAIDQIRMIMEMPRWFDTGIPVEIKVGTNWANAAEVI